MNPLLLIALGFLIGEFLLSVGSRLFFHDDTGGFAVINKYGGCYTLCSPVVQGVTFQATAPDPLNTESAVSQKNLYAGLFILGLPLLWFAAP